ncbi:MAG TPA: ADP-ribosylglycohydrolase family protein [Gemmatimonadales bacterium]|nr:ADP-ribosylglycohydrolase family protein [Gemmatimonadales bacterium]
MRKDTLPLANLKPRAHGLLLGLAAAGVPVDVALAEILGEEILAPHLDLERVAHRWAARGATDPGLDRWSRGALAHIAQHGTPPLQTDGTAGDGPLAFCLPVAIAARSTPRNLVSGSFHIALLTHPEPRSAWATVGINVAAAWLLLGKRDVLPDVLEVLHANDAPAELIAALRRVPFLRREELPAPDGSAVTTATLALWLAHHEPLPARGMEWIAARLGIGTRPAGVAAALLAARHGETPMPAGVAAGIEESGRLKELAGRLTGEG